MPREAFDGTAGLPALTKMIPTFEEKVLEHRDGHYIVQDWMGAITEISDQFDYTYIRSAKDFVTRKWHSFPVQSRADWEEKIKWRYDPADPLRFPPEFWAKAEAAAGVGQGGDHLDQRPLLADARVVGMEKLCMLMVDDPQLVEEMAEFWTEFTVAGAGDAAAPRAAGRAPHLRGHGLQGAQHDLPAHGAALPPAHLPRLARRAAVLRRPDHRHGLRRLHRHLIPIWIEAGINVCDPIEVAAGNDIVAFRQQFGSRWPTSAAIDKRAMAAGGEVMRDEVMRVAPLIADGGFIPGCDHGVPPDISWPNFHRVYTAVGAARGVAGVTPHH